MNTLARETPNCHCKIAKCIEMQLKIVNDFLTEIYISCPVDFKVISFVEINKINKEINKDPSMVPGDSNCGLGLQASNPSSSISYSVLCLYLAE